MDITKSHYCIYHSADFDGITSAAIVKYFYNQYKINVECIGWDYGNLVPQDFKNSKIYICDIFLPLEYMKNLVEFNDVIWIDHHKSSIDTVNKENLKFKDSLYRIDTSACGLTWEYFFDTEMPLAVKLLSDYDIHNNSDETYYNNVVLPFQYGLRSEFITPDTFPTELFQSYTSLPYSLISIGKKILDYQKEVNKKTCKNSFEVEIDGIKFIALNSTMNSSMTFEGVYNKNKHDAMLNFYFDGKNKIWKYSVYSETIDCSDFCKKRGGGGHKGAAGFESKDLII